MLDNLKVLRKEKNITQKELAEAIGVSQQSINKYENHNIEPDIGTLIRIADYFETSVDYLIGHTTVRHRLEVVRPYELNEAECALVDGFRALSPVQKNCVLTVVSSYKI